jgi:sulfur-oxidizing protein SoxY
MQTRRDMLARSASVAVALAGLGLLPQAVQAAWSQAAFDARTMGDLMKALGTSGPTESKDVTITGPDIAENGAVVPVGAATTLAGARRILLLVEKNPSMLAALFDITDAVEPTISTRVKMGQSSNVIAVAITADNKVFFAQKEIKVTLGGCGG